MFSKGDQRCWLKIEVALGKTATEGYRGLLAACSTNALPYRTVARWVQAFRSGRNETADLQRTGRPSISQEQIEILSGLLTIDHRWTVRELSLEIGLGHQTVWHIMKKSLKMMKIASRWVPHRQTEVQKLHRYALAGTHLERYRDEDDTFLQRIVAIDETWARAYEFELKRQLNEWRHQGSPHPQ